MEEHSASIVKAHSSRRKSLQRMMSIMMIFTMLLALLPPAGVSAAQARPVILNLYNAKEYSPAIDANIPRLSQNPINLEVSIDGLDPDDMSNLYYVITNETTGRRDTFEDRRAVPDNTGMFATFHDVILTEGLNKIEVVLRRQGSTQLTISEPGWAYFTPMSRVDNLMVDGEMLREDRIYPVGEITNLWSTQILISGEVYNATEIEVYHHNSARTSRVGIYNNFFSISADREDGITNSSFNLKPGDNLFTFTANNGTHSFQDQRTLIYNNGDSFAYALTLAGEKLVTTPTIDDGNTLNLTGKIKVNLIDGELEYDELNISINPNNPASIHTIDIEALTPLEQNAQYAVYDLPSNIIFDATHLNQNDRYHTVHFEFISNEGRPTLTQSNLGFYYHDTNLPYIESVSRRVNDSDNLGLRLSELLPNEIGEQPSSFIVYTDDKTDEVHVYVDDLNKATPDFTATATITDPSYDGKKFVVTLDGQTNGSKLVYFVPVLGASEHTAGNKEYILNFNTAPYLIFHNVTNNQVIQGSTELVEIRGRMVNVPDSARIEVFLNGQKVDDSQLQTNTDKTFALSLVSGGNNLLVEGRNTVSFRIYLGNQSLPTTTTTLELFRYRHNAPSISDVTIIDPDVNNPKFTPGSNPDSYFTSEDTVQFRLTLANVDNLIITHQYRDENDAIITTPTTHPINSTSFLTAPINLSKRGNTTIEFRATSDNLGIEDTRVFTITRTSLPYTVVYPSTFVNAKGQRQANINSNYSFVQVKAEYADSVVFGDQEAILIDDDQWLFEFEARELKNGENKIGFTVNTGDESLNGEIILNNVNQPIVGAQNKTKMNNRLRLFNNQLELRFPRNTSLMRKGASWERNVNQYLTNDRWILSGIANDYTGEIDPFRDPAGNVLPFTSRFFNFKPASKLYWIDAGTINRNTELQEALTGSGILPHGEGVMGGYFSLRRSEDVVVPTQPFELTIQYDPNITPHAWRYLTVYQYKNEEDSAGGRWVNLGGVVNTRNNTITVQADSFGYFQVMHMTYSFDDVILHPWAKLELDTMFSKGYMKPMQDKSFMPNEPITRGEFITILVKMFDIELDYEGAPTFEDVQDDNKLSELGMFEYKYIETAARKGFVRGTVGGQFQPINPITREEAAAMIAAVGGLKLDTNQTKVLQQLQRSFTDGANVATYHRAAVAAVSRAGFITGLPHNTLPGEKESFYFDPKAPMTRAEAAVIALRILDKEKRTFR